MYHATTAFFLFRDFVHIDPKFVFVRVGSVKHLQKQPYDSLYHFLWDAMKGFLVSGHGAYDAASIDRLKVGYMSTFVL